MISLKEAEKILDQFLDNPNLKKHCLAVSSAMKAYAQQFGITNPDEIEKWQISGLLHDADWEKYPDQHPKIIVDHLKKLNVDDDILNAILSHGFEFEEEPKTLMAKTLRAVDELTGLITAVALVKGRKLDNVTVSSILNKWKDKRFASGVNREDIEKGAKDLNIPLEQHIEIVLSAMKTIKDKLGLN
ncbi:MAG: HDIG domain-containing protein [Patescibacteria group bacterium]|nr:MAG: HDIG domain-containing protein [Patescibacteria group bacterium]